MYVFYVYNTTTTVKLSYHVGFRPPDYKTSKHEVIASHDSQMLRQLVLQIFWTTLAFHLKKLLLDKTITIESFQS